MVISELQWNKKMTITLLTYSALRIIGPVLKKPVAIPRYSYPNVHYKFLSKKGPNMGKTQFQVIEDQLAYLVEQFSLKPTCDFTEFEANKEPCPKCSKKMDRFKIPNDFRIFLFIPQEREWISSATFYFSGCQYCKIVCVDEDEFITCSNIKLRFNDFLDNISQNPMLLQ